MSKSKYLIFFLVFCLFLKHEDILSQDFSLKSRLNEAEVGDYVVMLINKTPTLLHVYGKAENALIIEEIVAPPSKRSFKTNWKEWITENAPGNTSWVMFQLDLSTGKILKYYSFTKKNWFDISDHENFLYKLLNLRLSPIPDGDRRKASLSFFNESSKPKFWQPPLIVEGKISKDLLFEAWQGRWPKDNSELSWKIVELYLPPVSSAYPSYFPYWIQVQNTIGKSQVRLIDSGKRMRSPKSPIFMSNTHHPSYH